MRNIFYYRFYQPKDVLIHFIQLVIMHVLLIPFDIWAYEMSRVGSYTMTVMLIIISAITISYYLYALIRYLIERKLHIVYKPKKSLSIEDKYKIPKDMY